MEIAIVGAGISGLATAQAIREKDPRAELTVYEASARPGGKVITEHTPEGYLCEWGVNAFLDKSPPTLELCRENGIPFDERPVLVEELPDADELFLAGTTSEILSIVQLDGRPVGSGRPGAVATRLLELFHERIAGGR